MNKIEEKKELATKRLRMRYPEPDDARGIYAAIHSPEFPDQLPIKEMESVEELSAWIKRLQELWKTGQVYSWVVEKEGPEEAIGQVSVSKMKEENEYALAFWIDPKHWRKGYATEAVERALRYVFEEMEGEKVWAGAGTWNTGSQGVLEKVGMKRIKENPEGYHSRGKPIATIEYEITKEHWKKKLSEDKPL